MRRITIPAAVALAAALLAGCGNNGHTPPSASPATAKLKQPSTQSPATTTIKLAWSHIVKDDTGDTEVWYVARVKNSGNSVASVAVDAHALDKTNTIVGSDEETLPNIPAHSTFDYFGSIGGGISPNLTGTPTSIQVSQQKDAFGQAGSVEQPMLKTSELNFNKGSNDGFFPNIRFAYDLSVKVTNNTKDTVTGGVTQQVVLYDKAGHVVGGGTGLSDNVPDNLPSGTSYREKWTTIPALHPAARAVYTVWAN